eukprot:g2270.t1
MATQNIVKIFEDACLRFRNYETRVEAENFLLSIRNSPNAVEHCKIILTTSEVPFAQFQAATILRDSALRDFSSTPAPILLQLCTSLLEFVVQRKKSMQTFVRQQVLQTICILHKRGWAQNSVETRRTLFSQARHLMALDESHQLVAMDLILLLVTEFLSTSASSTGLPLEFHRSARVAFENNGLLECFGLGLQMLQNLLNATPTGPMDPGRVRALGVQLKIVSQVLSYDFGSVELDSSVEANDSDGTEEEWQLTTVSPPEEWREALLGSGLAGLLLRAFGRLRSDPTAALQPGVLHSARRALAQLAALTGPIFSTDRSRLALIGPLLGGVMHTLKQSASGAQLPALRPGVTAEEAGAVAGAEQSSLCEVICRLISIHGLRLLLQLPGFSSFFEQLSQLTCRLLSSTVALASSNVSNASQTSGIDLDLYAESESTWLTDSIGQLIVCWTLLIDAPEAHQGHPCRAHEILVDRCGEVVRAFVESRLIVNRHEDLMKQRNEMSGYSYNNSTSVLLSELSFGYADSKVVGEELDAIAGLARFAGEGCLRWLRERLYTTLQNQIDSINETRERRNILLDGRWLIRVVGFILADDPKSEIPSIPGSVLSCVGAGTETCTILDFLERLLRTDLLRISSTQASCHFIMEGVTLEILRAWRRIVRSYVLPDSTMYKSMNFPAANNAVLAKYGQAARGHEGGPGMRITRDLLQYAAVVLSRYSAHEQLASASIHLLDGLCCSTAGVSGVLASLDDWWIVLRARRQSSGAPPSPSLVGLAALNGVEPKLQRRFTTILCRGCNGKRLEEATMPVERRLGLAANECGDIHTEPLQDPGHHFVERTVLLMHLLRGIVMAADSKSHKHIVEVSVRMLQPTLRILAWHRARGGAAVAVMKFLRDMSESLVPYMLPNYVSMLCRVIHDAAGLLSQHRGAWAQTAASGDMDDDDCRVLGALAAALCHLVDGGSNDAENGEAITKTAFSGLELLLPLATAEDMQQPKIIHSLYSLLWHLANRYTEALANLPLQSFTSFVKCLEFGISHNHYSNAATKNSLLAVRALAARGASFHRSAGENCFTGVLRCVLQLLLQGSGFQTTVGWQRGENRENASLGNYQIQSRRLQSGLIEALSAALLALIICEGEIYQRLVEALLQDISGENGQRLAIAFSALCSGVNISPSILHGARGRRERAKFQSNVENFIFDVRGCLITNK